MKRISYRYTADGFTPSGKRLPDLPVMTLLVRRRDRRLQGRGPAIVDTGFDGALYPSLGLVTLMEGMTPVASESLFHPLYGKIGCELYALDVTVVQRAAEIPLGQVPVYTPLDPDYLSEEALVGREILNRYRLVLDGPQGTFRLAS